MNDVPEKLATELEAMGTDDQSISDGYEAANLAAPYKGMVEYESNVEESKVNEASRRATDFFGDS